MQPSKAPTILLKNIAKSTSPIRGSTAAPKDPGSPNPVPSLRQFFKVVETLQLAHAHLLVTELRASY
jgi:hypothetical protein